MLLSAIFGEKAEAASHRKQPAGLSGRRFTFQEHPLPTPPPCPPFTLLLLSPTLPTGPFNTGHKSVSSAISWLSFFPSSFSLSLSLSVFVSWSSPHHMAAERRESDDLALNKRGCGVRVAHECMTHSPGWTGLQRSARTRGKAAGAGSADRESRSQAWGLHSPSACPSPSSSLHFFSVFFFFFFSSSFSFSSSVPKSY